MKTKDSGLDFTIELRGRVPDAFLSFVAALLIQQNACPKTKANRGEENENEPSHKPRTTTPIETTDGDEPSGLSTP